MRPRKDCFAMICKYMQPGYINTARRAAVSAARRALFKACFFMCRSGLRKALRALRSVLFYAAACAAKGR